MVHEDQRSQGLFSALTAKPESDAVEAQIRAARLIRNERWKYLATLLNTVGAAGFTAGIIAPAAVVLSSGYFPTVSYPTIIGAAVFWICFALALHCAASLCLGNLRP